MKKNQNGFSVVEILIVIVIIGLAGAVGWLVWDKQKNAPTSQKSATSTNEVTEKKTDNTSPESTNVLKAGEFKKIDAISIKSTSDVDKLPAYTPASFSSYMRQKMENNDTHGCGNEARVSIISIDTIAGSAGSTVYSSTDGICQGDGMGAVWYLDTSSKWNSVTTENACTGVSDSGGDGTKVSSTFMKNAMHDTCSSYTYTIY